ncbi:MAG: NAD(P)H-dependent glycerol-3-phosphate dehydrogenase [Alicyclobacillus macrosporangiidus]|uniref:NAD(P)H-dependent glycerol-3-phosphate dehydrogenase n=1 Tax=Alicyclobacillus macrosporangiidus TaxID=392015 RepID=UPI0026E930DC|nr:NAD(P)H-dependent glycerol-3-phosphate dehydrogenase [Alicyclobacillus macrosporangiidus]MCL6598424.1 NAD(P)H-dependent glycerol-3-phosphate dehydrogenase [Alicyclobacillus macrosporangiidus]
MNISVLGAGSWGTALAMVLVGNGHQTTLWARRPGLVDEIRTMGTNHHYLPGVRLPAELSATDDAAEALAGAEMVVYVVPSASMAEVVEATSRWIPDEALLVHAVKGFDPVTHRRMSQVILAAHPEAASRVCALTGPSHAEEVARGMPTTLVAAAYSRQTAEMVQDALMNATLRVYTNPDVVGAELGGALKNIIALGVGIADGLGYGDNAKAALMTRGLAEISRLGRAMGASPLTFAGLSGVGDLIVTCTSRHSRNFRAGRMLGQGRPLPEVLNEIGMVVEGVTATKAAVEIAAEYEVEMPISQAIYQVLFEGKQPEEAVDDLMGRERGRELEEVARDLVPPDWLRA